MKPMMSVFFFACALILAPAATAEAGPIRLALRDTTVVGGTVFSYPVYVDSSVTGLGVTSYELELTFSASTLSFVGITVAGTMTELWEYTDASEVSSGRIRIAGSGSTNLSGTGILVVLRFQAKTFSSTSYASVNFASALLNEGTPAVVTRNGTITVQVPPSITISPDTWTMIKGETKQFVVSGGSGPYTWSTTDAAKASIDSTGLLTALNIGFVRVICSDSFGVLDTSGIVEIRGLRLSIRDTSVYQGQTLSLPVQTTSVTGLGITSGQLTLTFNQNLWTATGISVEGTILASSAPEFSASPGSASISFAQSTPIAGSGTFVVVNLEATTSTYGYSNLGFANVVFNEDLLAASATGTIGVTQLATLNVTPGGTQTLVKGDSLQFSASGGAGPYTWSVSDSGRATISSSGLLKVLRGGSVTVTAHDANGSVGSSGTILLYDFRLTVPSFSQYVVTSADTAIEFRLIVTANDTGFSSYQFRLSYSTTYNLVLDSVITAGTLSQDWSIVPGYSAGGLQIAAAGISPVTAAGTLVKLRFRVPSTTPRPSTTSISLSEVLFNEGFPLPLVESGFLQIRSTNAKPILSSQTPASLDSTGVGLPTQFSVSAYDPDGDALTYFWKVNGVLEQSGSSKTFTRVFSTPSPSTTVVVVFEDPWGLKDSASWSFRIVTEVERLTEIVPDDFLLYQNYPNPFNPSTTIRFMISVSSFVTLTLYDLLGNELAVLVSQWMPPGTYAVRWEAGNFANGTYFYRLRAGQFVQTRKLVLLK